MKPKILYMVDNLNIGGAQTQLARLVNGLGDAEFDLRVLCLGDFHDSLIQLIGRERVAVFPMRCIWKPAFWISYGKVKQSIRANKPDIVHTYLNTSNVFGAYAARQARVPVIVTSRRDMGHFRSNRIAAMERWSNKFCQKVVCVSEAVRQQTMSNERLDAGKAVVLYGGVNTEVFRRTPGPCASGTKLKVGMVAAMDRPMKGHADFLKAAREVHQQNPTVEFILVGDGSLRAELERYVQQQDLGDVVIFKGQSADVQREMQDFDIFVMPSHSEGFSNAVLEAMAMGIPVLANALEGNLEILEDRETGLLVEPRNASQMAGLILHYADRPAELRAMGEKARAKIEGHFTLKHMVERYKTFYNGLLNG